MQLQSQSSHPTRKSFKLLCLIAGGLCFFILIGIYQLLVTQEHLSDNPRIPQKVSRKQLEQSFVEASHLQNLSVANRSNVGYGLGGFRNPALVVFCYNRYAGKSIYRYKALRAAEVSKSWIKYLLALLEVYWVFLLWTINANKTCLHWTGMEQV